MNTNVTIPTVRFHATADNRYIIDVSYVDGVGRGVSYGLHLRSGGDFTQPWSETMAQRLTETLQHVYLMGCDEGELTDQAAADDLRVARQRIAGLEADLAGVNERNERQRLRIEAQLATEQELRDQIALLDAQLEERTEERDALAESLEQAQAPIIASDESLVLGMAQSYVEMVKLHELGYSEGMQEDGLTGPAFDPEDMRAVMYNIGRQARISDSNDAVRIEALVGENGRFRNQVSEWERRNEQMIEDFDHICDGLNEQATEHRLCDQYEASIDTINAGTRILKLTKRARTWDLEFHVGVAPLLMIAAIERLSGVSDTGDNVDGYVRVSVQVECTESQIDLLATEWRQKLREAHGDVHSVEYVDYSEA